jgi:protease I
VLVSLVVIGLCITAMYRASRPDRNRDVVGSATGTGGAQPIAGHPPRVVFVLAPRDFWFNDFDPVRRILQEGGVEVVVASLAAGEAKPDSFGGGKPVKVDMALNDIKAAEFDAVIIGGGTGVWVFIEDRSPNPRPRAGVVPIRRVRNDMLGAGKLVTGLCMGSGVLADTGILKGKKATGFPDRGMVPAKIKEMGGEWLDRPVVEDGQIITGRDPKAAGEFAQTLLRRLSKVDSQTNRAK